MCSPKYSPDVLHCVNVRGVRRFTRHLQQTLHEPYWRGSIAKHYQHEIVTAPEFWHVQSAADCQGPVVAHRTSAYVTFLTSFTREPHIRAPPCSEDLPHCFPPQSVTKSFARKNLAMRFKASKERVARTSSLGQHPSLFPIS